jgi:predicted RNase H-like HicB family nuclease
MKYAVVFEKSATGYAAYVPDLPGCITTGRTLKETERLIREAIEFHIEGMQAHGESVPQPTTVAACVEVNRRTGTKLSKPSESQLLAGYRRMAKDRKRESEAKEWVEGLIGDATGSKR